MTSFKNFIFDLDGTLIDSKPGIQKSFDFAYFLIYGKKNHIDITPIIGPPIAELLSKHFGEKDASITQRFINQFKIHYDDKGYLETSLYPNVNEILTLLNRFEVNVYLATNKRNSPTQLILNQLGISSFFNQIYSIDSHSDFYSDKRGMLQRILSYHNLIINQTIMIGDTEHDQDAAKSNEIKFAYAAYGYGKPTEYDFAIYNILEIAKFL